MRLHIKELVPVPGKQLYVADTLSRLQPPKPLLQQYQKKKMNIYIGSILAGITISDQKPQQVRDVKDEDEGCHKIKTYCQDG